MTRMMTRINGVAADCVDSGDRGLLYGDGLFETMAVRAGRVSSWPRHMARLQAGCERLGIPAVDTMQLAQEAGELLAGAGHAVLKVIVTRGSGGRGYRVPGKMTPRRILQLHSWPELPPAATEAGVAARLCTTRLCHNPLLAGIKHLNRLEQVLARQEWHDPQIAEGLLLDQDDRLVEGTMSNLFLIRDRVLMTPDLSRCGVAGILRTVVTELADSVSLPWQVRALGLDDLHEAEEVFLTNSIIGIWPVIAFEQRSYRRGPLTCRLQELLKDLSSDGEAWLN
jgi:4-amino-4-deoxychorismate lyase